MEVHNWFIIISGTEIDLEIAAASLQTTVGENRRQNANTLFYLDGKRLRLQRPLDRDENDLSSVIFQVVSTIC